VSKPSGQQTMLFAESSLELEKLRYMKFSPQQDTTPSHHSYDCHSLPELPTVNEVDTQSNEKESSNSSNFSMSELQVTNGAAPNKWCSAES
jgi:hypothetical protein